MGKSVLTLSEHPGKLLLLKCTWDRVAETLQKHHISFLQAANQKQGPLHTYIRIRKCIGPRRNCFSNDCKDTERQK